MYFKYKNYSYKLWTYRILHIMRLKAVQLGNVPLCTALLPKKINIKRFCWWIGFSWHSAAPALFYEQFAGSILVSCPKQDTESERKIIDLFYLVAGSPEMIVGFFMAQQHTRANIVPTKFLMRNEISYTDKKTSG